MLHLQQQWLQQKCFKTSIHFILETFFVNIFINFIFFVLKVVELEGGGRKVVRLEGGRRKKVSLERGGRGGVWLKGVGRGGNSKRFNALFVLI